jgi:ribosomal protein L24
MNKIKKQNINKKTKVIKKFKSKYNFKAKVLTGDDKGKIEDIIKINKKKKYVILNNINIKIRFIPFVNDKGALKKKMVKVPGKIHFSNVKFIFPKKI